MNKSKIAWRNKNVKSALGSVRAEGLKPSAATQKRVKDYASGRITVSEMRSETLREIKRK
jgi:hypothetical protein